MRLKTAIFLLLVPSLSLAFIFNNKPVDTDAVHSEEGYSDVESVTLTVGQPAPGFTLTSNNSQEVSLSDFIGSPVILIFYRGHWCPYCVDHLEDINTALPELSQQGAKIIAISPDDVEGLKKMAKRFDSPYIFLSDKDMTLIDRYGIRRDDKLPHPAVIVIDKAGIVQWFYVGENYKKRPSASQLIEVFNRLEQ